MLMLSLQCNASPRTNLTNHANNTINAQRIQNSEKINKEKINKENKNTKNEKEKRIRVDVMLQSQDSG